MENIIKNPLTQNIIKPIAQLNFLKLLLLLALLMLMSGCGDKEPTQRKAFIDFIQTNLLATQTLRVPQLTDEQKSSFGEYSKDYAIITDFHDQMDSELSTSLVPVFASMNAINSVNALLEQRDVLQHMATNSADWLNKLKSAQTQANERHNALKQPQDLKAIYDQAYDKTVTRPAELSVQVFTLLPQVLNQIVAKADFIKSQGKSVTISGNTLQFATQAQLNKYNAIQKQLVPLNAQLMALSRQMQQLVR